MSVYQLRPPSDADGADGGREEDRPHAPVMAEEVVHYLDLRARGRYVDGTLGDGGHAERLLETNSTIELLGIDRDPLSLAGAARRLAPFGSRVHVQQGNFDDLGPALAAAGWDRVDGILLDLGVSTRQLDDPGRGFGFRAGGPLDMRMTPGEGLSAADLLATLDERKLAQILWQYGEEPAARRIARAIVAERRKEPLTRAEDLAELVARVVPRRGVRHPATRVFQALRIAVNHELAHLDAFLARALEWLRPRARLVVIAYHSLEDRRVKHAFREWTVFCTCPPALPRCACGARARVRFVTRRVVTPSRAEVQGNRRARSARLRAVEVLELAS